MHAVVYTILHSQCQIMGVSQFIQNATSRMVSSKVERLFNAQNAQSRMMRKYEEMMRNPVRQVVGRSLSARREDASGTPASLRMHGLFQMCLGKSQVAAGRRSCCQNFQTAAPFLWQNWHGTSLTKLLLCLHPHREKHLAHQPSTTHWSRQDVQQMNN